MDMAPGSQRQNFPSHIAPEFWAQSRLVSHPLIISLQLGQSLAPFRQSDDLKK